MIATGGLVRGPGDPGADQIPAVLTEGERVISPDGRVFRVVTCNGGLTFRLEEER